MTMTEKPIALKFDVTSSMRAFGVESFKITFGISKDDQTSAAIGAVFADTGSGDIRRCDIFDRCQTILTERVGDFLGA